MSTGSENLALVLGGGGARAAYQAGFLRQLTRDNPDLRFPIITGVSAGSINAAFLSNFTESLPAAAHRLTELWKSITPDQIFLSSLVALSSNICRWGVRLLSGGAHLTAPVQGLVDTAPLRRFLCGAFDTPDGRLCGMPENIRNGRLKAAAITTTNYATAQSVTWVQGEGLTLWERPDRHGASSMLTVDHVMASCALPLFFPAIQIEGMWHGDGGIRLTAPLSPALHLGAQRIFTISTRYSKTRAEAERPAIHGYPPPATVIGVLLNAVFLDMLDYDALVMERINRLLAHTPEGGADGLRRVELLMVRPSQDLEALAAEYESALPRSFRYMIRGLGTHETRRPNLLATILFAPEFVSRVMKIGEQDAAHRADELKRFLVSRAASTEREAASDA